MPAKPKSAAPRGAATRRSKPASRVSRKKVEIQAVSRVVVDNRIHSIRGLNVMLDNDLAELYQVETSNLNKAVKRNLSRFPRDFMFQLNMKEWDALIFQTGISKTAGRGGRRFAPHAFTEQGLSMLSSVLKSKRAVVVNIAIMRAFVRMREVAATHKELLSKIEEMERQYDAQFQEVFIAIKQLMDAPPVPAKRRIGFPSPHV